MFRLSRRSLERLNGVHPLLAEMLQLAIKNTDIDFTVLEGVRTLERQHELYEAGKSKTLDSRHLTGHAVDIAPIIDGDVSWDWYFYDDLANYIFQAADELDFKIEWGGDWKSFPDGPHWQLPWKQHPRHEKFVPYQMPKA